MNRKSMQMGLVLVVVLFAGPFFIGCQGGLIPLAQQFRTEYEEYLPQLQVYVSREILLVREFQAEEKGIDDRGDGIHVRREKTIESITIPRHTPGVIMSVDGDTLHVQFEPGDGEGSRQIPFSLRKASQADGGPQQTLFVFDAEEIEYDGQTYRVVYEEGRVPVTEADGAVYAEGSNAQGPTQYIATRFYPYLMTRPVEELDRLKENNRTVKGLRVENLP